MSVALDVDSLFISKDTISDDISFTHLADISVTPIILPAPAEGVVTFIDFISLGAG